MVKPDLDLWTGNNLVFRVVNRFCILCLIGSRIRSGNGQVGFSLLLTPKQKKKVKNIETQNHSFNTCVITHT
ncbi:hypothetical protein Hanom_Chr05g00464181 [Helianthus anomalus]